MVYIAQTQSITTNSTSSGESKTSLHTSLQAALEHARRLTQMYGTTATEVAVAWETVEELIFATGRQPESSASGFELYCALNPDAPECRIYDV